jgi:hypothetical protein
MGFGVSPKDNWRRLTKFFLNQFPVKSADYDDVQVTNNNRVANHRRWNLSVNLSERYSCNVMQ